MIASKRIAVLVTAAEKRRIAKRSKAAGLSVGEFLRRAAASFRLAADDRALDGLIGRRVESTAQASAAIDQALAFSEASNGRIVKIEWERNSAVLR